MVALARRLGAPTGQPVIDYHSWFEQFESSKTASEYCFDSTPKISIVVPCFNTPKFEFSEMLYSVINQFYYNWELVLINVSTDKRQFSHINSAKNIDKRIEIIEAPNKDISTNTNLGISASTGDYIALLDHDDMLTPFALSEVVRAINNSPKAELIYSDEDKVDAKNRKYSEPFFKPDFSPELLEQVNYITHFSVIKKETIEKVNGFDSKCHGAQDYDLFLKITDETSEIVHIPLVLYHWRKAKNSTAEDISTKQYIFKAGVRALNSHLKRTQQKATVKIQPNLPGFYKTTYENNEPISVVFLRQGSLAQQRVYIEEWLAIHTDKNIKNIFIHEEVSVRQNISTQKIKKYKDVKELTSLIKRLPGNCIVFNGYYASDFSKNWVSEICGLLVKSGVFSVSPLTVDISHRIVGAGHSSFSSILAGKKTVDNTPVGFSGFVRNVQAPDTRIFALKCQDLTDDISDLLDPQKHRQIILDKKERSVIWSHTPVVKKGHDLDAHSSPVIPNSTVYGLSPLPDIPEVIHD